MLSLPPGDFGVFGVDDAGQFERGLVVQIGGSVVGLFGQKPAEFLLLFDFNAFFSRASIDGIVKLWTHLSMAWLEQSGQVRFVSRIIESWRSGSIQIEVPVYPRWPKEQDRKDTCPTGMALKACPSPKRVRCFAGATPDG